MLCGWKDFVVVPRPLLINYVILAKYLNFSDPQFVHVSV